jgi:hypothetical protein
MLYNFPAKTLLVPSKPPVKIIHEYTNLELSIKVIFTHSDKQSKLIITHYTISGCTHGQSY